MALTPERILMLRSAADTLAGAAHGSKSAIASAQAALLGCDVATLYRQINEAGFSKPRKRRADAGHSCVSRDEVMKVMALKVQAQRANGKDIMSVDTAADLCRANGLGALGRVDEETGEIVPVSTGTLRRVIRNHGLDLRSLNRPTPHVRMRSLHPNHVWQIDASVCVLYYLNSGGLGVMEADEFYKNKPENFQKRAKAMVIRYSCTDHYTGAVQVRYYEGAESAALVSEFFIESIQAKDHEKEPVHGVPNILILDPGSANEAHMFKNLCRLLKSKLIVHKPKNPRAKGSVENSQNLIECSFESRLIAVHVRSIEELNLHASRWMRWFNGTREHTRHGHTRYGLWQTIRREQLRIAPTPELCRELLTTRPVERTVNPDLTIQFGADYSVKSVPHLNVGQKVMVARNPYLENSIVVIEVDAEGNDVHWACPAVEVDSAGFNVNGPVFGENYKAMPDTQAVHDRKAMDRLAYGVDTKLEVDAARRKRSPVFGGLDITGYLEGKTPAAYMPRPGTDMDVSSPLMTGGCGDSLGVPGMLAVETSRLNPIQLAGRLKQAMPNEWCAENYQQLLKWYPDGALETELPAIVDRFRNFGEPPRLAAAGGA